MEIGAETRERSAAGAAREASAVGAESEEDEGGGSAAQGEGPQRLGSAHVVGLLTR